MNSKDFTNNVQKIEEAMPMGTMSKLGQTIASKLPTFAPQTAAQASGKLEAGKIANKLMLDFQKYLGQTGQQSTKSVVLDFLQKKGYPTTNAEKTIKTPEPTEPTEPRLDPELSLVPKELELMPNESIQFRKLLNLVNEEVGETKLSSKQISNMLMAAVQEYITTRPQSQPSQNQTQQDQPIRRVSQQPSQQPARTTPQVASDFVRATDAFIEAGGRLTPQMKQKLQQLIDRS